MTQSVSLIRVVISGSTTQMGAVKRYVCYTVRVASTVHQTVSQTRKTPGVVTANIVLCFSDLDTKILINYMNLFRTKLWIGNRWYNNLFVHEQPVIDLFYTLGRYFTYAPPRYMMKPKPNIFTPLLTQPMVKPIRLRLRNVAVEYYQLATGYSSYNPTTDLLTINDGEDVIMGWNNPVTIDG